VFFSGNTKNISNKQTVENQAGTIIKPNAKIPSIYYNPYLTEIDAKGISNLFDTGTSEFDLILNYYFGEEEILPGKFSLLYPIGGQMLPLNSTNLLEQQFTLTVDGENSVGQIYAMPYLKMLGNHEPVTMQFLLPLHIFLEVRNLLKPQNLPTEMQTRWIMVNNIKMLPIQMKFEFATSKQFIKAEIKMGKMNVEI